MKPSPRAEVAMHSWTMSVFMIVALRACVSQSTSNTTKTGVKKYAGDEIGTTVVVVLADDVDDMLTPLQKVMPSLHSLRKQGFTFTNSFVTTPVCCPSRASIFSGRYQHNTRCFNNSISGGCSSPWWKDNIESNSTFATELQRAGWQTFYGQLFYFVYYPTQTLSP